MIAAGGQVVARGGQIAKSRSKILVQCVEPDLLVRDTCGSMKPMSTQMCGVNPDSLVSIRVVRGLVEAVERAGISRSQFLGAARLDVEQLDSPEVTLPRSKVYRLCELAMDLTHDPALGLHWGECLSSDTFNPISELISHSGTLRQGLDALCQFCRLLSDAPGFRLIEQDAKVTIHCVSPCDSLRAQRFNSEMLVLGFVRLLRFFSATSQPDWVGFAYPAPAYVDEYQRVFGIMPRFDQPFTGVEFDRELLDARSPHKDEDVHAALRMVAERRILRLTRRVPFALRVRDVLVQQGPSGRCDMEAVARTLGLSPRSLRRRLAAEGKSYDAVADEARTIIAKHLLLDQLRTIQETAHEMGFADTSTFHRAFKRWTGMTPKGFREQRLRNDTGAPMSEW
jgi:AraC-like DNA-binding protein